MSIEKNWNDLNDQQDEDLSSMLQRSKLPNLSSHNPLEKIKKNLLINMIWGVIICILYIAAIFYFHIWQVQTALTIVLLFSLWALYTAYLQYRRINPSVSTTGSVLAELKKQHQSITEWMNTQQRVGLFIYPVSAAGGFMLGGAEGSGKPVEVFMQKPVVLFALLIAIVILVPACYYLTKWMFNLSFGKHLKGLQKNIKDLEEEK